MPSKPNHTKPQEAIDAAIARSAVDAEFRKRLLDNPRAAAAEVTNLEVPPDLKIAFMEKPANVDLAYVLPDLIPNADELSEEELEAVAGGLDEAASLDCTVCTWTCGVTL